MVAIKEQVKRPVKSAKEITIEDVKKNQKINEFIEKADRFLGVMGYTEHGLRHCSLAANIAYNIIDRLGKPERLAQLAAISAYMHDMGNIVNRDRHAQIGAVLAHQLLSEMGMPIAEIFEVMAAIGNHDEKDGYPVNEIGAAVILADKSDVHRSRVRTMDAIKQDIHDRVNYAATSSFLRVDAEKKTVSLEIKIDTHISSVMEYFEIFLSRMVVCRRAAKFLGMRFELEINGHNLL
ncbi:MAG: HD domain-containing protein [candidate division Zixibacteria bacterium]|nr:HD domain-containing protein [candidate division Zixibacteria bacterium]